MNKVEREYSDDEAWAIELHRELLEELRDFKKRLSEKAAVAIEARFGPKLRKAAESEDIIKNLAKVSREVEKACEVLNTWVDLP